MPNPAPLTPHPQEGSSPGMLAQPENVAWRDRRDRLRERLQQTPLAQIHADEVDAHFNAMPGRYWETVTEDELVWGVETIHGFLRLVSTPSASATAPFVDWRHASDSSSARVMLCSWDRHGLLAKAAAAFSAVRLNILRAAVYTRSDHLVLDVFHVISADGSGEVGATRIQEMTFLLEGALSEPPRFASVWACSRHKYLAEPTVVTPRITFDNDSDPNGTVVRVEAADRLGLLYDLLQSMADSDLEIVRAGIFTENGLARDELVVADRHGQKIIEPRSLEAIRTRISAALALTD